MKLITEEISKVEFITEGAGSDKKCYIKGISYRRSKSTVTVECIPCQSWRKKSIVITKHLS